MEKILLIHTSCSVVSEPMKISEDELLSELQRLGEKLSRTPKMTDMDSDGKYSSATYQRRFDGWTNALVEAGFEPNRAKGLSKDYLERELRELAEDLGRPPSELDIRNESVFAPETYRQRYGSTADAREAAGLLRNPDYDEINKVETDSLILALYDLAQQLGRPPTASEINRSCEYSTSTYVRRFGSVKKARKAAGLAKDANKPQPSRINPDLLLQELRRLAVELGRPPRSTDVQDISQYSRGVYENHFDSWQEAIESAGLMYFDKSGQHNPNWKDGSSEYYYGKSWEEKREEALERDKVVG